MCKGTDELVKDLHKEFRYNHIHRRLGIYYKETVYYKECTKCIIFKVCELNNTFMVAAIIHGFLKSKFFEKPMHRKGVYKTIKHKILPVLWKDHRAIERKKQKKLSFLAKEFNNGGQYVKAHIVWTIVKPCIRDMNLKWSKMTCVQKIESVVWDSECTF